MKKILTAILAFLYISTSIGATVNVHYCMGKLAGWEIGFTENKTCEKCGMQKTLQKQHGCCNDEMRVMQNNADQCFTQASFYCTQFTTAALPVSFFEWPAPIIAAVSINGIYSHSPPKAAAVAVYIRNCVFLI